MNVQEVKSAVFNDTTTTGKTGKVAWWSALSLLSVVVATTITNNPQLFNWRSGLLVVVANIFLIFIKNLSDKNTPNT